MPLPLKRGGGVITMPEIQEPGSGYRIDEVAQGTGRTVPPGAHASVGDEHFLVVRRWPGKE